MISVEALSVRYGRTLAVDSVDFSVRPGEVLGLIGPNGSGKTSLLRAVLGALAPASGSVRIDGENLRKISTARRATLMSLVSQSEELGMSMTVREMVLLGRSARLHGWQSYRKADYAAAEAGLKAAGVLSMADRSMEELSGGERQRVLIARAIAQDTPYMLLDEPTNHLDIRYQHEVLSLLSRVPHKTVVVVLHDLNLAARYCSKLALMSRGRLVAQGSSHEVLTTQRIDEVYEIAAAPVDIAGVRQLFFRPSDESSPPAPGASTP